MDKEGVNKFKRSAQHHAKNTNDIVQQILPYMYQKSLITKEVCKIYIILTFHIELFQNDYMAGYIPPL